MSNKQIFIKYVKILLVAAFFGGFGGIVYYMYTHSTQNQKRREFEQKVNETKLLPKNPSPSLSSPLKKVDSENEQAITKIEPIKKDLSQFLTPLQGSGIVYSYPPETLIPVLQEGIITKAKFIGHTSLVYKITLQSEQGLHVTAIFKARSKINNGIPNNDIRYRSEIAAYRLSQALGLINVPIAIPRSFPLEMLSQALMVENGNMQVQEELKKKIYIEESTGLVVGAIIPWISGYEEVELEKEPAYSEWSGWLMQKKEIPKQYQEWAREISNLIVFDYLIGNFDRWSGGNIAKDRKGKVLLFIDNDGSFLGQGEASLHRRLKSVNRFSGLLFGALKQQTPESLQQAIGEERLGEPLLKQDTLDKLYQRIKEAEKIISAKDLYFDVTQ